MTYPDRTLYLIKLHGANRPDCGTWHRYGREAADKLAALWVASAPGRTATISAA